MNTKEDLFSRLDVIEDKLDILYLELEFVISRKRLNDIRYAGLEYKKEISTIKQVIYELIK